MTDQEQQTGSVFDRLDTLSDQDLSTLVAAAADVLAEGGDDPTAQETIEMPPGPAARELQSELTAAGLDVDEAAADGLVSDDAVSREVALVTLRELAKQPELAAEIEAAWKERSGMMVIDGGVLIGAALLLLVMKLKRVKVKDVEVEFYEAKSDIVNAVRGLVGA